MNKKTLTSNTQEDKETKQPIRINGIQIHSFPHDHILFEMHQNIEGPRSPKYISITNTESLYHALRLPSHRNYIENAHFSLCDGVGVVIAGRFEGKSVNRFNGPILMLECCQYGVEKGWRHFFYGGREEVADKLSEKLSGKFPGMITGGTHCPPFRELNSEEEMTIIQKINNSNVDVLWVGLGLLKQERWIFKHIDKLNVPWCIGVGAAFDYHTGMAKWAPSWIRNIGLEWLYRLWHEPRMLRRNIYSFVFLTKAILNSVQKKDV